MTGVEGCLKVANYYYTYVSYIFNRLYISAEGFTEILGFGSVCCVRSRDVLSCQPLAGPSGHVGRRLDGLENLDNHLLPLLATLWRGL
jgi:hypothetical protein